MRDLEANTQYEYMERAKAHVEALSKEIGRPLTYFVKTFGCQMPPKTTNVQPA